MSPTLIHAPSVIVLTTRPTNALHFSLSLSPPWSKLVESIGNPPLQPLVSTIILNGKITLTSHGGQTNLLSRSVHTLKLEVLQVFNHRLGGLTHSFPPKVISKFNIVLHLKEASLLFLSKLSRCLGLHMITPSHLLLVVKWSHSPHTLHLSTLKNQHLKTCFSSLRLNMNDLSSELSNP